MRTVNEKELKEINLSPADYIVSNWKDILKDDKSTALVTVINNELSNYEGYILGVATENERGYKPLMILADHNYKTVNNWVDQANSEIYDREPIETYKIVMSSMR